MNMLKMSHKKLANYCVRLLKLLENTVQKMHQLPLVCWLHRVLIVIYYYHYKIPIKIGKKKLKKMALIKSMQQDRKSTRLNSSHVSISYAVFCLKKKIKKTHTD